MWVYEKKLEYPVKIKTPNPALAKIIVAQYGGGYCINYGFYNRKPEAGKIVLFGSIERNQRHGQVFG